MKKLVLTLLVSLAITGFAYAQWTTSGNNIYNSNTGSVGIGTTNPQYKLNIAGTNTFLFGIQGNDSTFVGGDINLIRSSNGQAIGRGPSIQFQDNGTGHAAMIQGYQGQLLFFGNVSGWTERMRINASGNVLIGKTTQVNTGYKLDVNGNVRANQVTVNTTGADFVFNPAYKLYPLAGLKKYLGENHHLPGIAPAKEMQADGLNLGDNQTKLLQKVEELTLYMISADQQMKLEQEMMKKQQALLLQLRQQLKAQQKEIVRLKTKN